MTISERIQEKLRGLPEPPQREVLDFVEYLAHKRRKEDDEWSRPSRRNGNEANRADRPVALP